MARFGGRLALSLLWATGQVLKVVLGLLGLSFWWLLAAWQPAWGAILGLAFLAVFSWLFRTDRPWRKHAWLAAGLTAFLLWAALNLWTYRSATQVNAQRKFETAAYDMDLGPADRLVVLSAVDLKAFSVAEAALPSAVPGTNKPQRLVNHPTTQQVYIANYGAEGQQAVTEWGPEGAHHLALPACRHALGITLAPRQDALFAVCESSCTLHQYDLPNRRQKTHWPVPCIPYAVAVDETRGRAYVTSEIFSASLTAVWLDRTRPPAKVPVGLFSWGVVADEATGNIWVARPIVGEVWVFDSNLALHKRLPAGCAPRDLALDPEHRRLLAGNYLSNTISVFNLNTLAAEKSLRVGQSRIWRLLRGVAVTAGSQWWAADSAGVWQIQR